MKQSSILAGALAVCFGLAVQCVGQTPVPPPEPEVQLRSPAELDQMLGPIALYPDPLIAEILPAATLPSQIVLDDRYIEGGGDPNLIDQQEWDGSVQALARYPTVLKWMDDNLAWTTTLGQAFVNQQQDVMDSIQRLRVQAQALGNLQSTPQENVVPDQDGTIEILPPDPQVIYVPVYQPDVVYFQRPAGAPFISFGLGFALGGWLNHDFDWHDHHLIVWRHDAPRPADWWSRRPGQRPPAEPPHAVVWRPHNRPSGPSRDLDRGWGSRPAQSTVAVIGGKGKPGEQRPPSAAPPQRPRPTPEKPKPNPIQTPVHAAPARPATGALIGVQSTHETRQFSTRGQESRQAVVSHPAAAPSHAAAPQRSEAPKSQAAPRKR